MSNRPTDRPTDQSFVCFKLSELPARRFSTRSTSDSWAEGDLVTGMSSDKSILVVCWKSRQTSRKRQSFKLRNTPADATHATFIRPDSGARCSFEQGNERIFFQSPPQLQSKDSDEKVSNIILMFVWHPSWILHSLRYLRE